VCGRDVQGGEYAKNHFLKFGNRARYSGNDLFEVCEGLVDCSIAVPDGTGRKG